MQLLNDPDYLKNQQYSTSNNLSARIALHQRFSTNTYDFHRWLFDLMLASFPAQARILECGCGRGDLWAKNADRLPAGWQIALTDFSEGMLEDAKANIGVAGENIRFEDANVQDIPYEDNAFDAVCANFMLYHAPDRNKAIAELRRVLKPDGVLHTATVGLRHMHEFMDLLYSVTSTREPDTATHNPFTLENGAEQLLGSFGEVTQIDYPSNLAVTELQPLVDYARSTRIAGFMIDEHLTAFTEKAQAILEREGVFHITKYSGTFVSRGYEK